MAMLAAPEAISYTLIELHYIYINEVIEHKRKITYDINL